MSNMTVYMTDGDYRLVRLNRGACWPQTFLEHKCPKPKGHVDEKNWEGRIYHTDHRGWACSWCKSRPADGLQALFWIMKEEPNG